ncbi:tRNA (adenosine(37)-N6)-threonylcarbamoyltransferase complex ATPase subunit type 1 TsaE [Saccharopolyspora gloriosae]|uniref:tRNA (adenosine(37)-N6)-threonylcarbamoyltransferase complex ATPase subunit type 1 TsaE n=1 Tax=Saccharopolyspora gloriosae TaxID=455344 RepID=UPI001FB7DE70|nr:tRNA (adenosine(37)-N6)-threonylcarbamoyltransferase complex ATPase subunit type 1 TsaE [Saccharopolyspora gloriosae]
MSANVASTAELTTPEEALEFGRRLGSTLRAGDLVVLDGPLGAGKTVLAKGIAAGMGVTGQVTSPTFVIARVHRPATDGPALVHVDAYRLGGLDDIDDLDLDTDLTDAVVVVEWGAEVAARLADEYLMIRLHRRPDDVREVTLEPHGDRWHAWTRP